MNMGRWSIACWIGILAVASGTLAAGVDEPLAVQPGVPQLFIDDQVIESQDQVVRTLHQPTKDDGGNKPIISSPRGSTLLAYGTIVFDTRLKQYVMFLQDLMSRDMYRVLSDDGMHWSETDGGKLEKVTLDTNLGEVPRDKAINAAGNRGIDVFSCHYDSTDAEWPYKGWCWFANWGNDLEGIFYVRSRDGKKWERGRQVVNGFAGPGDPTCRIIEQDGKVVRGPGDVTLFSYDPVTRRYLGIFKFFNEVGIGAGNSLRSRAYLWLDRLDEPVDYNRIERIALLPPGDYRNGDTAFDEYYATTAWRYGSMWLGTLKIFHPHGNYPHSSAGCAFFKLVSSRDGLNWSKVPYLNDSGVPEIFVPNGKQGGANGHNDGGYMSEFSQGPLRVGDELIFYYSASSWGKNAERPGRLTGGGIFRARLPVDRFVSVDEGIVTTRSLRIEGGKELRVNAVGPVKVEVLDPGGQVLGSAALKSDSTKHIVTFEGSSLGDLAKGTKPRLRFTVEPSGQLYAFSVR
jgi:hypothetical protein